MTLVRPFDDYGTTAKEDFTCPLCQCRPYRPITNAWNTVLSLEPPSGNVVAKNSGGGRFRYQKFRNEYEILLTLWRHSADIPVAKGKRRVTFTRFYVSGGKHPKKRGQMRDAINNAHGHKPLLDAMHLTGLLVNDTTADVEDFYRQQRVQDEPGVGILLEEFGE